ncbi:DUF4976 domain-containing protein [Aureibaculum algae]|uniref:DUF4976 domain-containing protein n=1 Tax=Aureibaculum algae TaxID=2584122 RepID=A0A5B7TVT5_9FLAO|nr:sulfatase-like hydrolase/transferase [Aureibaculum algae]QCX40368.1 DUF4976 domain-containing protein [Aureibaculum algae]
MKICYTLIISFVILTSCKEKVKKVSQKPNIVFILTDDQTYSSIHALGNDEIITPAMDKLAETGTTFTHAYNMGSWSGAVCTASRTMFNSGRFVWRANKFRQNWLKNDSINKTWAKLLQASGYETYMTGKWHIDAPAQKVFNHTKNIRPGMPNDAWDHAKMVAKFDSLSKVPNGNSADIMPKGYNRPLSSNDTSWSAYDKNNGGFWKGGKHWSEVLKDDALEFIDSAKTKDTPFFMYLAFNAPHDPRQAPKEYLEMYPLENLTIPKSFLPENPYRHEIGNGDNLRDEALAPFPRTEYAVKVHKQEYYASITHVDAQIGAILDALKKSGKMDNTYIIFTADHGLAMGRTGFLGKQNLYDHSIRPPLMIVGPTISKNKRIDEDVYLQDVMATALEIGGVPKPTYVEFKSFLDLAEGRSEKSHYKEIYGAYLNLQRMIRKDGYKLLVYPEANKVLLYNMKNDPEEMIDISDLPENRAMVQSLFEDLLALQKEMDDPLDLTKMFQEIKN